MFRLPFGAGSLSHRFLVGSELHQSSSRFRVHRILAGFQGLCFWIGFGYWFFGAVFPISIHRYSTCYRNTPPQGQHSYPWPCLLRLKSPWASSLFLTHYDLATRFPSSLFRTQELGKIASNLGTGSRNLTSSIDELRFWTSGVGSLILPLVFPTSLKLWIWTCNFHFRLLLWVSIFRSTCSWP